MNINIQCIEYWRKMYLYAVIKQLFNDQVEVIRCFKFDFRKTYCLYIVLKQIQ